MKLFQKKTLLATAAVGAAVAPAALGQVVVNQSLSNYTSYYIDLDTMAFSESGTGKDLRIQFREGYGSRYHGKAFLQVYSGTSLFGPAGGADRFTLNQALSGNANTYSGKTEGAYGTGYGNWGGTSGSLGYVGFARDGNMGWIHLDYNPSSGGGGGSISVISYDWDSNGGITQAGVSAAAVPEPASTAAIAALLAGGAVFFHRRRRKVA